MGQAQDHPERVVHYWNLVAPRYLELYRDELSGKPYDQETLKKFAATLGPNALVCDAGCGPCGHINRVLADAGAKVVGIDISPKCVDLARQEQPSLQFEVMDMGAMDFDNDSFDGLIAYYSLHYQAKSKLGNVVKEFARVLRPNGRLLIAAKAGEQEGWIADPLGSGEQVFWSEFTCEELQSLVVQNGFQIEHCAVREPLPSEISVRRIYVTALRMPA